ERAGMQANADRVDLERELERTRENLQTTVEELETSNEELKSANEELQSTNEELQSSNEELETSKEEMGSLNEELTTLNSELQAKVEALARTNDDMNNLLNSMQVATIFLDTKLRVKRYTEQAREVVRLISSDIGRPLSDLTSNLRYEHLLEDCRKVLASLIPIEQETQNNAGRWYLVRLIPYRTGENVIEGLVVTIIDIDRTKKGEAALQVSEDRYQALVAASAQALYRMSPDWSEMRQLDSRGFLANTESPNRGWLEDYIPAEDQPRITAAIQAAIGVKGVFQLEHRVRLRDGSVGWAESRAIPVVDAKGEIVEWFGAATNITARKKDEEELRQSREKYRLLFESTQKSEGKGT
ncbi:MAG TPA: PAS domain-containing protein, partial [Candidatus Methylomirabilis sp.]|nr:PAS domain-containing protein [Candidatus Methylomirabilis sp.]